MPSLISWRNAVLNPIEESSAVGSSARLGEVFDTLQQEVGNDLALVGQPTDWRKVLTLSQDILATQSKDLLVLVYSMRAVIDEYRYEGFVEVLAVLNGYIEQYWVDSFPPLKRKRARVAAFEWFAQQLERWVESNKPNQEEAGSVESVLNSVKSVNQLLSELGEDWSLDLFTVTRSLNEHISSLPSETNIEESKPVSQQNPEKAQAEVVPMNRDNASTTKTDTLTSKPHTTSSTVVGSIGSQIAITDDRSHNQSIRHTQSLLKELAKYRLSKNLADPRAYEINRFSVWLPVAELPLHQNGLTPLRSIPAEKRHFFETLFQQRQYEILVVELESSLSNAPFWLDGHRMVVDSLNAIDVANGHNAGNGVHQKAIDVISTLTKAFTTRFDGVECLKFSDDSPFADDKTQSWLASIESINSEPNHKISEDFSLQPTSEVSLLNRNCLEANDQLEAKVINDANLAFKASGFSEGFSILDQYCHDQTRKQAWYKARLLVIEYCFNAKEYLFAEQLLVELDEITLNHNLDVWEPEMVSSMLSMMLICKTKLKRKHAVDSYYQRLVRVDTKKGYEMKSLAG